MKKINKEKLRKLEKLTNVDQRSGKVKSVIFPNRFEVGADDSEFKEGGQFYGNLTVSGSVGLESNAYINFGEKMYLKGYGFRDNNGTLQFKNSQGGWTTFGTAGNPAGESGQVQFNDANSFGADSNFSFNKTTDTLTVSNLTASLTKLPDGTSLIAGGNNITIVTGSSGQITISSTGGGGGTPGGSDTQVQFNDDGSAFGGDSGFVYNKSTNTATVTNISSSLTRLSNGSSYLVAGPSISISSGSSGQVTVSSTLSAASGSTSVASVSTIAASDGIIVVDEGSGRAALTASIGVAEDGSYSDGLFTDFTSQTRLGVAIDRFNEVLKGLAPGAAPSLDDMDSDDTGSSANLSFGSSQSISGYTNAQPSTLSSPASSLSDVNINGSYISTTSGNDIRAACFNGSTTIEGTLNEDISADGVNYPANAFGNGDQGTLSLFVNNNTSAIHSVDLSSHGSGNSLNNNGSGFINLSAADPAHFSDGSSFNTFKHRTGSFRVTASDQRNGWNYARVTHVVGSLTSSCNYVEWVNDSNSNALSGSHSAMDSLSMSGLFKLSGVRYNTAGTAEYRVRVSNAYRNVYSSNNITFTGTRCSISNQSIPSINTDNGENELKVLHITGSATINTDPILNNTIGASINVPHPLKSNLSNAEAETISGILLYNLSNTSTVTSETFRRENYRLLSGSYNSQSDVTDNSSAWDSEKHMSGTNSGYQDGLMFYNSALRAPRQGVNSGDFRNSSDGGSIANGPAENVNYSGITSGTRTFYRYFQNNSGGAKTDFSLAINGSGTIVSHGTSLGTGNISVLVKLPTTSGNQSTGWMDLAVAFATGQTSDGDGCLNGSLDSSLNATNSGTFGTVFVDSNEYIMIKIEADASFTGNISSISLTWS